MPSPVDRRCYLRMTLGGISFYEKSSIFSQRHHADRVLMSQQTHKSHGKMLQDGYSPPSRCPSGAHPELRSHFRKNCPFSQEKSLLLLLLLLLNFTFRSSPPENSCSPADDHHFVRGAPFAPLFAAALVCRGEINARFRLVRHHRRRTSVPEAVTVTRWPGCGLLEGPRLRQRGPPAAVCVRSRPQHNPPATWDVKFYFSAFNGHYFYYSYVYCLFGFDML